MRWLMLLMWALAGAATGQTVYRTGSTYTDVPSPEARVVYLVDNVVQHERPVFFYHPPSPVVYRLAPPPPQPTIINVTVQPVINLRTDVYVQPQRRIYVTR